MTLMSTNTCSIKNDTNFGLQIRRSTDHRAITETTQQKNDETARPAAKVTTQLIRFIPSICREQQ